MRKLHVQELINWVDALPRVINIHNDMIGVSGLSPYHILFGRDRLEGNLPYTPPTICETAENFFNRMKKIDDRVMEEYEAVHLLQEVRSNKGKLEKSVFKEGDKVWVLRPQGGTATKLESWWLGPARVVQRIGERSYQVVHKPGEIWEVHRENMKPYVEDEIMGTGVPLYYHQGGTKSTNKNDVGEEDVVGAIKRHRIRDGKIEFLVRWKGARDTEESWEPSSSFITTVSSKWMEYLTKNGLEVNVLNFWHNFKMKC